MKKILFILWVLMPVFLLAQSEIINLDPTGGTASTDSSFQSIEADTIYLAKDSVYITAANGDLIAGGGAEITEITLDTMNMNYLIVNSRVGIGES
ncbi:hypothetical protein LCGC14_1163130, partial [marine sediment metagenome]